MSPQRAGALAVIGSESGGGAVSSVNGQTGAVVLTAEELNAQGPVVNLGNPIFNAALNGTTDDTNAVINGIDAVAALTTPGQGGVLFVPFGLAAISNTIMVPDDVTIRGITGRASGFKLLATFPGIITAADFVTTSGSRTVTSASITASMVGRRVTASGVPYGAYLLTVDLAQRH